MSKKIANAGFLLLLFFSFRKLPKILSLATLGRKTFKIAAIEIVDNC